MLGVASVQFVGAEVLLVLVLACLAVVGFFAHERGLRLFRRIRVLLFAILLLFAWFTPGEVLLVDLPALSPTREGALLAFLHASRLIVVVGCVALLLEHMPPDRLVSGLYALCRPASILGLSAHSLALRLLLVLRYVDEARTDGFDRQSGGMREWKRWLLAFDEELAPVKLVRERFGPVDAAVLVLLVGLLGWWMW